MSDRDQQTAKPHTVVGPAGQAPPVEMTLSGDFGSPAEVLAAGHLTREQKHEIFNVWLSDVGTRPLSDETDALASSIRQAIASL